MTSAQAATIGQKENCAVCGVELTCVEIPATQNYPSKHQWHNTNGGAHYNFDSKTKHISCNKPSVIPPQQYTSKKLDTFPTTESLKAVIPYGESDETLKTAVTRVQSVFREAHGLTRTLYPNLKEDTELFGQIRCRFVDHLFSALLYGKT